MNRKRERDEHLERLWYMKEEGQSSLDELKCCLGGEFNKEIIRELLSDGLVKIEEGSGKTALTKEGEDAARKLIRAHRLAERLLHDVLGGDFESGACEFEHTVNPELVDSICTLLGHPRECPHGMPIPEGECCRRSAKTAQSSVALMTEMKVGESCRVAYINCRDDQQLHKLGGLHIRPGAIVKLHQTYPSYVIECEGANIALDKDIARNICVWKGQEHINKHTEDTVPAAEKKGNGRGRGLGLRRRRRGR